MYTYIGFIALSLGWLILIYAGWRNQRAAARSSLVETTNFLPRLRAIIEVVLHPDHATSWYRRTKSGVNMIGEYTLVFPNLGKDSSEIAGIREDDGKVT